MFHLKVDKNIDLQLLQHSDSTELFQLINGNREHLRQWIPWIDNVTSPFQYHILISQWLKQFQDYRGIHLGIRYRHKLAGMISLNTIDWHNRQTSIGYFLANHYEGRGIVIKSVSSLLHYIFKSLHLHRVEIRCGVENKKSLKIPERLGFTKEGIARDSEFLYDHYHDLVIYSMLSHEWKA